MKPFVLLIMLMALSFKSFASSECVQIPQATADSASFVAGLIALTMNAGKDCANDEIKSMNQRNNEALRERDASLNRYNQINRNESSLNYDRYGYSQEKMHKENIERLEAIERQLRWNEMQRQNQEFMRGIQR